MPWSGMPCPSEHTLRLAITGSKEPDVLWHALVSALKHTVRLAIIGAKEPED